MIAHTCHPLPYIMLIIFLIFREMLAAGSSEPWPQILYRLTKERELRVDAMLEYFEPLLNWLRSYREKVKYPIGWPDISETFKTKNSPTASKELDKPIILTNSSKIGLSYLHAVAKATNANLLVTNITGHDKTEQPKLSDFRTFNSVSSQPALKSNWVNTQSRSVLGPLSHTKSSILTRPVFVPSTGKEPLTLVRKNDANKYSSKIHDLHN